MADSPAPVTAGAATPATSNASKSKKRKAPVDDDEGYDADVTPGTSKKKAPAKKHRKPNKTPNKALEMAKSYELCADHDKLLIDMRDEGKSWDEIRKAWYNMTGDRTAHSTLPNRYSRLKSSFVVIKEEDNPKLIEAKHQIDAEYEREKWHKISQRMQANGTEEYKADALKRQYQKLMVFADELRLDEGQAKDDEQSA